SFYGEIRRYWPELPDGSLQPGYCGIRPKLQGDGEPVVDFVIQTAATHGIPGLVTLYRIDSPGLPTCLALADLVAAALEGPRNRADDARHPDDADLLVHLHLGQDCRVRVARARGIMSGGRGFLLLDAVHAAMAHGFCDRHRTRGVARAHQPAFRKRDLVRRS